MKRLFFLFIFLFSACRTSDNGQAKHSLANNYTKETQLLADWVELLYFHIKHEIIGPTEAGRIFAYFGITTYEALVNGMPNYQSLGGRLNEFAPPPTPPNQSMYWPAVMVEANYAVASNVLSFYISGKDTSLKNLRDKQIASFSIDEASLKQSLEYGRNLGFFINEWMETDHFEDIKFKEFRSPSREGDPAYWTPTDINMEPLQPFWKDIRTMVLDGVKSCHLPQPFPYSEDPNSDFYKYALEVLENDKNLTEEKKNIALFWADCPGETATPAGHWMFIACQLIESKKLNLEEAAILLGMVGVAIQDAFIQCWYTKYEVNLVRPKTYIQEVMDHPNWEPYVFTPPFPEYASGHSVVSSAVANVLSHLLGDAIAITDSTHARIGLAPRKYTSIKAMAKEAAYSRMYGGIHYLYAVEDGVKQGECVAEQIISKLNMQLDESK